MRGGELMPVTVVQNNLAEIARQMEIDAARATLQTAIFITNDAKNEMRKPKSGRTYGRHRASAPGEAPAVDTSNLINSFGAEQIEGGNAVAYNTAETAPHLEYGAHTNGHNMAARPFMTPAAFRAVEVLWKLMKNALAGKGVQGPVDNGS
jgi:hypothetical protein